MPSVVISHLFGTIGVLALFISITLFSNIVFINTELENMKLILQDIAEYVASEAVGLVGIAERADVDVTLYKRLNLMSDVNNKGYSIAFINSNLGLKVIAYIDQNPHIKGEALLNIMSTKRINITDTTLIHSGTINPIIICKKEGESISLSFGVLS